MVDSHVHSTFSPDGIGSMEEILQRARALGMQYIAFTEHLDLDYMFYQNQPQKLNIARYAGRALKLREQYPEFEIAIGVELGYCAHNIRQTKELLASYPFDVIINSVHMTDGKDAFGGEMFLGKTKKEIFGAYLDDVLKSVTSDIPYDIVGHIGYISRYAPYPDKKILYGEFPAKIDDILKAIIERDATLEVNAASMGSGSLTLPDVNILNRYKSLGGTKITYGSDAHSAKSLCRNYHEVMNLIKSVGYDYVVIYSGRQCVKVKI